MQTRQVLKLSRTGEYCDVQRLPYSDTYKVTMYKNHKFTTTYEFGRDNMFKFVRLNFDFTKIEVDDLGFFVYYNKKGGRPCESNLE